MADKSANLKRLIDLAKEPSSDKRRDLLRDVTDLFLDQPAGYSARETEYFGDIIGRVAYDMEMSVRQHLATRLADVPEAPHALINQLANDHIDVALPLLMKSGVLKDSDLVAIAKSRGQEHLAAMTKRAAISAVVSDAIVERADDTTLVSLVSNSGAELSRGAMETIVERAENHGGLQSATVSRADLPADLLNEMFFVVSGELRRYIMERMQGLDPAIVDQALRESQAKMRRETSANDGYARASQLIDQKARDNQLNEQLLVSLLRAKQIPEVIVGFARLTGLDPKTARRVMFDRDAEALAIACKASRFDRATFSTLALLTSPAGSRSLEETYELLGLYDKVPAESAQRVMRFWKVRKAAADGGPTNTRTVAAE